MERAFNVKTDFGALGDGENNDTDAFAAMAAAVQTAGGGQVTIPPGTYIVGKQEFADGDGKGYAYQAASIFTVVGCSHPVVIDGYGATLKFADGLRFGSFDPVTGLPYEPGVLPFTDRDFGASVGSAINLRDNASVTVRGLEIDGNSDNLELGGLWGDAGRQRSGDGLRLIGNHEVLIEDVYTHHHGLDGLYIGWPNLNEASPVYPHVLKRVVSTYNARQGLSWTGGTHLEATDCDFSHTGRGAFGSSPQAGVDIEPTGPTVCRNGTFVTSRMGNNVGCAMVADSGDSAGVVFDTCTFIGTTSWALWPNKPRFSFVNCTIAGAIANAYGITPNQAEANAYMGCTFTDEIAVSQTLYLPSGAMFGSDKAREIKLSDCTFTCTRSGPGNLNSATLEDTIINVSAGTDAVANFGRLALFSAATLRNVTVNDLITENVPANGYYIDVGGGTASEGVNEVISAAGKIRWGSSWAAGHAGEL